MNTSETEKHSLIHQLRHGTPDASTLIRLGVIYSEEGVHSAAVLCFEKAITFGITDPDFWITLARAYQLSGNHIKAIHIFRQILSNEYLRNGWIAWTIMEYGRLLIKLGLKEGFEAEFSHFLDSPNGGVITATRAVLIQHHATHGDLEAARAYQDQSSVWSHMFIASACSRLKEIADQSGTVLTRPSHSARQSDIGMSIDSLGYYGRFGHTLVEYLHIREYADQFNIPIETPDWVGHYVFELSDLPNTQLRRQVKWNAHQIHQKVENLGAEALCGFDFFSPGGPKVWTPETSKKAREIFKFRAYLRPYLDDFYSQIRGENQTVIAFHIRLGDLAQALQDSHKPEYYLNWLQDNWDKFKNPILYIGSDDTKTAIQAFAAYNPVSFESYDTAISDMGWLYDFYAFTQADIVAVSMSGFSRMACILSQNRGAFFLRPSQEFQTLTPLSIELDPWA